jgi:hypothetical protein
VAAGLARSIPHAAPGSHPPRAADQQERAAIMNEFWQKFDGQLARLEYERNELRDDLAAWDEIPDISEEFVLWMGTAYHLLNLAIGRMKAARGFEEQS